MPHGRLSMVGIANSETTPAVVIRPILLAPIAVPPDSVNHSAPSGPDVTFRGKRVPVAMLNSVMTPAVVICAILLPEYSENHRLLSGPITMLHGELDGLPGMANSEKAPAVVT